MKELVPILGIQVDEFVIDFDVEANAIDVFGPMGDFWGSYEVDTLLKIVSAVTETLRKRVEELELKEKETES